MKYRNICLCLFIIFVFKNILCYGQRLPMIDQRTLKEIVKDHVYDLKQSHLIDTHYQDKMLRKITDKGKYSIHYDICSIQTFIKWCNKFLQEKADYIVFRTPILYQIGAEELDSREKPVCDTDSSAIVFDPFYETVSLNDYIINNKIIINVKKTETLTKSILHLNALIPFENKYYLFSTNYNFFQQIKFDKFRTKDIKEICKKIGYFIGHNPDWFLYVDGNLNSNFIWKYFRPAFDSVDTGHIKQIELHPESAPITLKELFR